MYWNEIVLYVSVKSKPNSYLAMGKAQLNACAFSDGVEKQKCCLGAGKNCHNFSSLQFFNSKLGRMLCNGHSNRFCDFYNFPMVGTDACLVGLYLWESGIVACLFGLYRWFHCRVSNRVQTVFLSLSAVCGAADDFLNNLFHSTFESCQKTLRSLVLLQRVFQ